MYTSGLLLSCKHRIGFTAIPSKPRKMLLTKVASNRADLKRVPLLVKAITACHSTSSTIDNNEVLRFKKLSPTWWDEMGNMKALHSMNRLRVPLVRDGLINKGIMKKEVVDTPKPLKDILILEVGCGGGIFTEAVARLGSTITGIDVSPELIEQAHEHAVLDSSLSNLKYSLESVEDHAKNNNEKYDAVVTSEVLEHVAEKNVFLEACVKCLKPGGIIFAENLMKFVPPGTHDWHKFIPPHHTQRILEENKCRTRLIHGLCYNFLINRWDWIESTSVNYALHAVKDK